MARKIIDTYPVFTVTVGAEARRFETKRMTPEEAQEAQAEFADMLDCLRAQTGRQFDVDSRLQSDAVCEHCRCAWIGKTAEFNDGCCGRDEANDPERLKDFAALAADVRGADLHRSDDTDGRRGHYEFADFGQAVEDWLKADRPADSVPHLVRLAESIDHHEWGDLWTDPGVYPSNAGSGPLPDRWSVDDRPNQLAQDLCSLLDDMGLLPATSGRAA